MPPPALYDLDSLDFENPAYDLDEIRPGISVTDACIGWATTEVALREFATTITQALQSRNDS